MEKARGLDRVSHPGLRWETSPSLQMEMGPGETAMGQPVHHNTPHLHMSVMNALNWKGKTYKKIYKMVHEWISEVKLKDKKLENL